MKMFVLNIPGTPFSREKQSTIPCFLPMTNRGLVPCPLTLHPPTQGVPVEHLFEGAGDDGVD